MPVNPDFRDLFAALNGAGAEYLLVGGHAVAFHVAPRFTKDLDVWVRAMPDNAERVIAALKAYGAPLSGLMPTDLTTADMVFMMGVPPPQRELACLLPSIWAARSAAAGETLALAGATGA